MVGKWKKYDRNFKGSFVSNNHTLYRYLFYFCSIWLFYVEGKKQGIKSYRDLVEIGNNKNQQRDEERIVILIKYLQ